MRLRPRLVALALILGSLPQASPALVVDGPACCTVPQTFTIRGTAMESDVVHVWAWPASGPVFLGAAPTTQADAGRQLSTGAFALFVTNAPIGTYPIVVYAHDPITHTFPTEVGATFTVRACVSSAADWPFIGPGGMPVFYFALRCV